MLNGSFFLFLSSSFLSRFYVPFHFLFFLNLINIRLSSDNLVLYYNLKIYKKKMYKNIFANDSETF